jgi:hypothetical protein
MRMNTNLINTTLAVIGLFCGVHCSAQSPSDNAQDCDSEASMRQVVASVGGRVEALTARQREQAKETFELAKVEGGKRGWDAQQQRAVVRESLTSPDYLALEEKKAPLREQIAAWARAAKSVTTMAEAQSLCQQSAALTRAVEASFAINTLEVSIAQQIILRHP